MARIFLLGLLTLLAACQPNAPPTEARVTLAEVVHGASPNAYRLRWATEPAGVKVNVEWSATPDFKPGQGELISAANDSGALNWQADPNVSLRRYFAIIPENGAAKTVASRLLPLEGGRNFRDLGGYLARDGRQVMWGRIFRSGAMHELTDADYDYLATIGIRVICDFREAEERLVEPTNWQSQQIEYLTFSDSEGVDPSRKLIFDAIASPEATPEHVVQALTAGYVDILKNEREDYTSMFDQIAKGNTPLAFHCSAGKDRTGAAAALLLTALDVPRETVLHDYGLSDDYVDYLKVIRDYQSNAASSQPAKHPMAAMLRFPPEKVAPLLASDPAYLDAAFQALDAEYGSVLAYIQSELEVTDEELAMIRSLLLE